MTIMMTMMRMTTEWSAAILVVPSIVKPTLTSMKVMLTMIVTVESAMMTKI